MKKNVLTFPWPQENKWPSRHCSSHVPRGGHVTYPAWIPIFHAFLLTWSKFMKKNVSGALNPSSKQIFRRHQLMSVLSATADFDPVICYTDLDYIYIYIYICVCVYQYKLKKRKKMPTLTFTGDSGWKNTHAAFNSPIISQLVMTFLWNLFVFLKFFIWHHVNKTECEKYYK